MGQRTISDEEYFHLQGRKQVADLIEPVWNHPATGQDARRLVKTVYPDLPIADYDIPQSVRKEIADFKKERADKEEADRKTKEKAEWDAERERVQKDFGFTEEGMKKLEDFMLAKRIASYEVAATYHVAKNPKPTSPTQSYQDQYWNHGKTDLHKEMFDDPEAWGRGELLKALEKQRQMNGGR